MIAHLPASTQFINSFNLFQHFLITENRSLILSRFGFFVCVIVCFLLALKLIFPCLFKNHSIVLDTFYYFVFSFATLFLWWQWWWWFC